MVNTVPAELIEDFLGSAHMFALALSSVLEARLLADTTQGRLTPPQLRVLKLIASAEGQTVGGVASFLGTSNAAASKILERLVRRKLLRRTEAAADRRSSTLSLTAAGRHLLAGYQGARARLLHQAFGEVNADDLARAAAVLDHVAAGIVTHSSDPEQVCLQCGIYFKERCLIQEVVRRSCRYRERKDGQGAVR